MNSETAKAYVIANEGYYSAARNVWVLPGAVNNFGDLIEPVFCANVFEAANKCAQQSYLRRVVMEKGRK